MSGITMCLSDRCPSRSICRRHAASGTRPDPLWQSYHEYRHQPLMLSCPDLLPAAHAPERVRESVGVEA